MTVKLPEIGKRYKSKKYGNIVIVTGFVGKDAVSVEREGKLPFGEFDLEYFASDYEPLPDSKEHEADIEIEIPSENAKASFNLSRFIREGDKLAMTPIDLKPTCEDDLPPFHFKVHLKEQEEEPYFGLASSKEWQRKLDAEKVEATKESYLKVLSGDCDWDSLGSLRQRIRLLEEVAQNLVNALEEKGSDHVPDAGKMMEESLPDIWKDISKLPEAHTNQTILVRNNLMTNFATYSFEKDYWHYMIDGGIKIYGEKEFCYLKHWAEQQEQNTKDIAGLKLLIKGK